MTTYIIRRLLLMIPTLIGITFMVFMLVSLAPGGIGAAVQAQTSGGNFQANSGVAVQAAYLEDRYGLKDPRILQYLRWLGRISPIKFGQRDQLRPNGEVVRSPRPIPAPPLHQWFGTLPAAPKVERTDLTGVSITDRALQFRVLERQYIEARFSSIESNTIFQGRAVQYARAIGRTDAIDDKLLPRYDVLAKAEQKTDTPEWVALEAQGKASIAAYEEALKAHSRLKAYFESGPFEPAGIGLIPGVLSVAWPDFGTAFSNGRPVLEQILDALPVTILLNFIAIPIIYLVAVPSGILASVRKGSWFDYGLGSLYIMLYSFPVVLAGVLCVGFLANRDFLGWFPAANLSSQESVDFRFLPSFANGFERGWLLDRIWHICLPVLCLVYTGFAVLSKQTRAAMLENFNADYVRTAKAKGVAHNDVVFRHVFRNSLIPLITIFVSVFPSMLAGSIIVERIFTVPGMGSLLLNAAYNRDIELMLANTVMIGVVSLVALLLADILYALADPRVVFD